MSIIDTLPSDLGFLGSGFPLFYNYLKFCKIILCIQIIFASTYSILSNLSGDFCYKGKEDEKGKHCHSTLANHLSLANIKDSP
jgi:hypothetical protein